MEPISISLIVGLCATGAVAVGSLIASVCTYASFKESVSAFSNDEQCVQVDNEYIRTNDSTIRKQNIKIHSSCLAQMQQQTSLQIPVENKTATAVGTGAVNALGGMMGGIGGGAPDMIGQVTDMAGNIASNAMAAKQGQDPQNNQTITRVSQTPKQVNNSTILQNDQQSESHSEPELMLFSKSGKIITTSDLELIISVALDPSKILLFDQHGDRVFLGTNEEGSDIEVNLYYADECDSEYSSEDNKAIDDVDGKNLTYKGKEKESYYSIYIDSEEDSATIIDPSTGSDEDSLEFIDTMNNFVKIDGIGNQDNQLSGESEHTCIEESV